MTDQRTYKTAHHARHLAAGRRAVQTYLPSDPIERLALVAEARDRPAVCVRGSGRAFPVTAEEQAETDLLRALFGTPPMVAA